MYDFIISTFRGAFVLIFTRGGWIAFGEVIDGVGPEVIGLTTPLIAPEYVAVTAIDMIWY